MERERMIHGTYGLDHEKLKIEQEKNKEIYRRRQHSWRYRKRSDSFAFATGQELISIIHFIYCIYHFPVHHKITLLHCLSY